jgi:hypothetical protein
MQLVCASHSARAEVLDDHDSRLLKPMYGAPGSVQVK